MRRTQSIPRCTNQQCLALFSKRVTARLATSVNFPTSVRKNLPQPRNVDSRTKCRHCFRGAGIRQPGGALMEVLRASSVKTSFLAVTLVFRRYTACPTKLEGTYVAQMVAPD